MGPQGRSERLAEGFDLEGQVRRLRELLRGPAVRWEGVDLPRAVGQAYRMLELRGRVEEGVELLLEFKQRAPRVYQRSFPPFDWELSHYFLDRGDLESLAGHLQGFLRYPERAGLYLVELMDALRIGGAAELARSLIFRCWVRLRRHRGNLAPRWLDEIGEASFYAVLVEGVEAPEEEVSRALQRLGHRIGRRWLREARCILRGSLSNAWRPHDFPPTPEGRRNLVLMGLEFLRYLCLSRGLAPLQADALRQLVVRYLLETARPTDPSLLLFEEYRLEACLSAWTNGLPPLGSRGFALLAGLEAFWEFLGRRGLVEDASECTYPLGVLRQEMRRALAGEAWKFEGLLER